MQNKSKFRKILLIIITCLITIILFFIIINKIKEVSIMKDNSPLVEKIYKNINFYNNKQVTLDGYIFGLDVKSETKIGNKYLNLRDNPSMEKNINFSMEIISEDIKNNLINTYNNSHPEWIHVEVFGTIKSIYLPMNGTGAKSAYIEVNNLIIK